MTGHRTSRISALEAKLNIKMPEMTMDNNLMTIWIQLSQLCWKDVELRCYMPCLCRARWMEIRPWRSSRDTSLGSFTTYPILDIDLSRKSWNHARPYWHMSTWSKRWVYPMRWYRLGRILAPNSIPMETLVGTAFSGKTDCHIPSSQEESLSSWHLWAE